MKLLTLLNYVHRSKGALQGEKGVSLAELLIAVAILGTSILAGLKGFETIQKSIQTSKARTLATNLAQEKIQILKQQSYSRLMVSTSVAYNTNFTPSIAYDQGYYAPESILEGGISFTRLTYVQVAQEDSGNISTLPDTTPDTGMKLVTTTVIWRQNNGYSKVQVRSIDSNSDTVMAISILQGLVRNGATSTPIQNAMINVAENVGWRDTTNASGNYLINLSPGNYTIVASADGYFTRMIPFSIAANQTLTQPTIDLVAMSSGTVRGTAWINDHLVISQVVGSTVNASGFNQEYVEIFNPSTFTWTIASNATTPLIDLIYQLRGSAAAAVVCDYSTLTIAPGGYYLFANTGTITAVGTSRSADAVFTSANAGYPNIIKTSVDVGNDAAGVAIAYTGGGATLDQVGWETGGNNPPLYEGTPLNQNVGLEVDEQFVRRTSTTSTIGSTLGRAYDNDNNDVDFIVDGRTPMLYPPRNSSDTGIVVAGTPARDAIVTVSDGLSNAATTYMTGSVPYAQFFVPGVATGTWTMFVTSSTRYMEFSSVTVTQNTTTYAPNAGTSPVWPSSNYSSVLLSSAATMGFVSGRVTNAAGSVISPAITISAQGGGSTTAGTNGNYLLSLLPGSYLVRANPSNLNSTYVSQDQTVTVALGAVTSGVGFTLSQGGRIGGRITRDGINGLTGIAVTATNSNGITVDQEVSGTNGYYTLVNLATGTYTIEPILDTGETSSPLFSTVTVTAATTVTASTFTISGAYGVVTGTVTKSGTAIKTGVLLVVSTATISGVPPTLSSATLTGVPYYAASSLEDGSYSVSVRGSTTTVFRVHGFYTTFNGSTPSISTSVVTGVSITPGGTTSGVNFSW